MGKVGRPRKPGKAEWVPLEILKLVKALKAGDYRVAVVEFVRWMDDRIKAEESALQQNKPNVNSDHEDG